MLDWTQIQVCRRSCPTPCISLNLEKTSFTWSNRRTDSRKEPQAQWQAWQGFTKIPFYNKLQKLQCCPHFFTSSRPILAASKCLQNHRISTLSSSENAIKRFSPFWNTLPKFFFCCNNQRVWLNSSKDWRNVIHWLWASLQFLMKAIEAFKQSLFSLSLAMWVQHPLSSLLASIFGA